MEQVKTGHKVASSIVESEVELEYNCYSTPTVEYAHMYGVSLISCMHRCCTRVCLVAKVSRILTPSSYM